MSARTDRRTPATTFLVHFFGHGLVDEGRCYAVEWFVSLSNGDIRRRPDEAPRSKKARSRPKPEVATWCCLAIRNPNGITNCCWINSNCVCRNSRYPEYRPESTAPPLPARHLVVPTYGLHQP